MTNQDDWRAAYRLLSVPELCGLVAAFAEARRLGGTASTSICDERLDERIEALEAELERRIASRQRRAFAFPQ